MSMLISSLSAIDNSQTF